jgi:hypothetical protein
MGGAGLTVVNGAEAGAWIAPRLEGGFGGKVEQLVPNGYDGYVRVFHALTDADGNSATWVDVAATCGRVAHREMQWHKLIGLDEPSTAESLQPYPHQGTDWGGGDPPTGEMDPATLNALCAVLARHTDDTTRCFFGLSTVHGGVEEHYSTAVQLRWRARDFIVFAGPLDAAGEMGYEATSAGLARRPDGGWESRPSVTCMAESASEPDLARRPFVVRTERVRPRFDARRGQPSTCRRTVGLA